MRLRERSARGWQPVVVSEVAVRADGAIEVVDGDEVLVYTPYEVTAPDGTRIAHESRGGTMASV